MSTSFGWEGKGTALTAGMVHSVSGCTLDVQVKLWDLLRTRAIPERLRGVFMTKRYTRLLYLTLYLYIIMWFRGNRGIVTGRNDWVVELPDTFWTFRYCIHIFIASFWLRQATNCDSQPIKLIRSFVLQKQLLHIDTNRRPWRKRHSIDSLVKVILTSFYILPSTLVFLFFCFSPLFSVSKTNQGVGITATCSSR